jgi:hypothetical protein
VRRAVLFGVAGITLVLLLATAALLAIAIGTGSSAGGTLASGRSVVVHSDSIWLNCQLSSDTATIQTAGKTIVVAPGGLVVDGRRIAPLDEGAKSVVVNAKRGSITLEADGKNISTSSF